MSLKNCALVQYRFYLAEKGLSSLVSDANAYLKKIGVNDKAINKDDAENQLTSIKKPGGHIPLYSAENKCSANHAVIIHFYHDTYILQIIANAKQGSGWIQLNNTLRINNPTPSIAETIFLFQGEFSDSGKAFDENQLTSNYYELIRELKISTPLLWSSLLDIGYFVQLSDAVFLLASTEIGEQEATNFVLNSFPRMMMYREKASYQKVQYDHIFCLMDGEEPRPLTGINESEVEEWQRHYEIIPNIELETNRSLAFVTEKRVEIKTIGSEEARSLTNTLTNLRLNYARLTKAVLYADTMRDAVFVNIENYLNLLEQLKIKDDSGFITNNQKLQKLIKENLSHEMARHKLVVERTQNVLAVLNEYAQDIRSLQAQEETRLQSIQTSLIAAFASFVGLGQLFASIPALQIETELKVWTLLFAAVFTFTMSYVVFNLKRANTWFDYLCSGTVGAIASLLVYLTKDKLLGWLFAVLSIGWAKVVVLVGGFIIGLIAMFLLGRHIVRRNRS